MADDDINEWPPRGSLLWREQNPEPLTVFEFARVLADNGVGAAIPNTVGNITRAAARLTNQRVREELLTRLQMPVPGEDFMRQLQHSIWSYQNPDEAWERDKAVAEKQSEEQEVINTVYEGEFQ